MDSSDKMCAGFVIIVLVLCVVGITLQSFDNNKTTAMLKKQGFIKVEFHSQTVWVANCSIDN